MCSSSDPGLNDSEVVREGTVPHTVRLVNDTANNARTTEPATPTENGPSRSPPQARCRRRRRRDPDRRDGRGREHRRGAPRDPTGAIGGLIRCDRARNYASMPVECPSVRTLLY